MTRLTETLRQHSHFIIVATLLIVVMTFPTIVYVFNTEVYWLPTGNHPDTWHKIWDAWYGKRILAGQSDYYYTDLLFYPQGASLVFHNFSIPHVAVFGGLQALMPVSNAYSLTFLLIVAAVTGSAYVYMLYLFKDKWIALLGAVIIGLSPHVVGYPEHPEYRFIATVPLALYYVHRGLAERRTKLVFYGATITGLTAYVGMHVSVCLVIMLGLYWLYFLASRWKEKSYWIAAAMFAVTAAFISAPRVVPMLENARVLEEAVGAQGDSHNDLLEYFVNARHPLTKALFPERSFTWGLSELSARYSSYLGYSVLFLVGIGLLAKGYRRNMSPWLVMAIPFLFLRLGSVLTIGGVSYPEILLPKHYLDELLPAVTESFRMSSGFHLGTLVPLAPFACFGASALLHKLGHARRPLVILLILGIVCFEYYQPVRQGLINEEQFAFVDWLQKESDEVRLIHVPIGDRTRVYSLLTQTYHGFPIAEGDIARTPPDSYDYIRRNHVLDSWQNREATNCSWQSREQYLPALDQLAEDGFTHVILHGNGILDSRLSVSFVGVGAAYSDDYVTVYRISELRAACDSGSVAEFFSAFPYADVYLMPSIIHERNGLVMSFHQSQSAQNEFIDYFSKMTFDRKDMVHIHYDRRGEPVIQSSDYRLVYLENISGSYNGIWLINDPRATDQARLPVFRDWLKTNYVFCKRYLDRADATIDLYLKPGIPCEALGDRSKFEALYDSGARLLNVSTDVTANRVMFYLVFAITREHDYSFSIQFFDAVGQKALQYDNFIFYDAATVHSVDISSLPDGAYEMKLIVYDPETGATESGILVANDQRFEGFLDIGTIVRP